MNGQTASDRGGGDRAQRHRDVHLILRRGNRVLLSRRAGDTYASGLLHMPSGHLGGDFEDVVTRLIRAAEEELGILIRPENVRFALVMQHRSPGGENLSVWFFEVTQWFGHPRIAEPDRCSQLGWFPLNEPPADMVAYCRAGLEAYRHGHTVALHLQEPDDPIAWTPLLGPDTVLVSLMKGVERGSALLMSEVIAEVTGAAPERIAVVSGPNLVREIASRQPAASVVACQDEDVARRLQAACHTPYFRPYTSTDVVGCELGGAVKNVIALAVGITDGLGLGDNTKAALITRGLSETTRLADAMGADVHTLAGLAGLGDLVATCSSPLSRNRTFGGCLGRGMTLAQAAAETRQTAEGVTSCESVLALAHRHGVDMPITKTVVSIVHGGTPARAAVTALMSRAAKPERIAAGAAS